MEPSLTHEEFIKHVNSTFEVQIDQNSAVQLELTEISTPKLYPKQEQFAIVFRGPLDMFLGQGTRSFTHNQMGQFEIFLVPIRQDEQSFYYEAVFNRIRE
jgi:uncharacterized protein DUF6916